jgi:DNA primase large subunit
MSDKTESANLILKLYELRREEVMRKARNWFVGEFHPGSPQDISNAAMNSETSAYYRMVTSYWDMACSFVTNGAIDEKMFNEANGEHMAVFAKIEPFLAELRQTYNNPTALQHLERVVMNIPDAREKMTRFREMIKQMVAARAQAAQQ